MDDVLVFDDDAYRLAPGIRVWYDAAEFQAFLKQAAAAGVRLQDREDDVLFARAGEALETHGLGHLHQLVNGLRLELGEEQRDAEADRHGDQHGAQADRVDLVQVGALELDVRRRQPKRLVDHQIGDQRAALEVADDRADRHPQFDVLCRLPVLVLPAPALAVPGLGKGLRRVIEFRAAAATR
mgnify:CR=1 FL=1